MDKETLSNYGWIVICVLVLAVLLALASPFGSFVANAVKSTTQGLFDVNQSALNSTGLINIEGQSFPNPSLNPDDGSDVYDGMIYTFGNYEYRYNCYFGNSSWTTDESQNGWGVHCIKDMADPGPILESINGEPIINLNYAFKGYTSLTNAPKIPNSVTDMRYTFSGCTSLEIAPKIPSNVKNLACTFLGCTNLTTAPDMRNANNVTDMTATFWECPALVNAPVIPNSVNNMYGTFYRCSSLIVAPVVPNGVTDMSGTFWGCTNLKTYVGSTASDGDFGGYKIPSNVKVMYSTFEDCVKIIVAPDFSACTQLTDMSYTFYNCNSLKVAPIVPNSVTNMECTFQGCTALSDLDDLTVPSGVTNMKYTFRYCNSITGVITINATPTSYDNCLYGTQITEILGSCTIKSTILATK